MYRIIDLKLFKIVWSIQCHIIYQHYLHLNKQNHIIICNTLLINQNNLFPIISMSVNKALTSISN